MGSADLKSWPWAEGSRSTWRFYICLRGTVGGQKMTAHTEEESKREREHKKRGTLDHQVVKMIGRWFVT